MKTDSLTKTDLRQLAVAGIPSEEALRQIAFLKNGVKPVRLNRPCTVGDGIISLTGKEQKNMAALYDVASRDGRAMKFVPASGAASRMFAHWHSALAEEGFAETASGKKFAANLHKLALFPELNEAVSRRGEDMEELLKEKRFSRILGYILTERGLNYGHLPKALLAFHAYADGSRTAIEEHLVEAALYTADSQKACRIHFTVSEEYLKNTQNFLKKIKGKYEKTLAVNYQMGISQQRLSSNTLAQYGDKLYREASGRLILRPGGHGALLENLDDLEGDIIFIKNIDNIVPDRLKPVTVFFKKVLAGCLISLQEEIFGHLRTLKKGSAAGEDIQKARLFCKNKLHIVMPSGFDVLPSSRQQRFIINKLNRPLRVCGMVKNEGEPGGGPFWVDKGGTQSLQIVEHQQIDANREDQRNIWSAATHFNPVDLVCGIRDHRGCKFDLLKFADAATVTISQKIEKGKRITVLEHPGLWNGSMARWNTIFMEVPIETFNPVKTIDDLLRPQHLPA
jgi:hypothetical protein